MSLLREFIDADAAQLQVDSVVAGHSFTVNLTGLRSVIELLTEALSAESRAEARRHRHAVNMIQEKRADIEAAMDLFERFEAIKYPRSNFNKRLEEDLAPQDCSEVRRRLAAEFGRVVGELDGVAVVGSSGL